MSFWRPLLFLSVVVAAPVFAEDAPPSKFATAKKSYEDEVAKIHGLILQSLEKRSAAAQRSGQGAVVAVIASERKALEAYGEVPPNTPVAQQRKLAILAKIFDEACTEEIKALTKSGDAAAADTLEKEQVAFRRKLAIQSTRKMLLGTWFLNMGGPGGYSSDLTFFPDGTMFHSTENFRGYWEVNLETYQVRVSGQKEGAAGDLINLPLDPAKSKGHNTNGHGFTLVKKK